MEKVCFFEIFFVYLNMEIYDIISETEKAIKVKYPYFEKTSEFLKKHKQKYVEQWIPKSIVNIEQWIKTKMYERGFDMNSIGLGVAPEKEEINPFTYPDTEKIKIKYDVFYKKVFDLTGIKPHPISGFETVGAFFIINGKEYDFEKEYEELKKYNPIISKKRYE